MTLGGSHYLNQEEEGAASSGRGRTGNGASSGRSRMDNGWWAVAAGRSPHDGASVRDVRSRLRHAAVAAVLLMAAGAAVLVALGAAEGEQELAQQIPQRAAQLLASRARQNLQAKQDLVVIQGVRAATQQTIDSGEWDPKVRLSTCAPT